VPTLLTRLGNWLGFGGSPQAAGAAAAPDLAALLAVRRLNASYDAARSGTDLDGHWAHADGHDADSANSRDVRETLVRRSRYETGSNGYYAGIHGTHANMLVGTGPTLRMLSGNHNFNQLVEREWFLWSQAVKFRRKLWCAAHARSQDGEAIGLLLTNPAIKHRVQLDLGLIETEQCQTPRLPFGAVGYIDGIKFDAFGNAEWYDILPVHPGSEWYFLEEPQHVPAKNVLHWFKQIRPGQHRGTPDLTSTLNTGASSRRWREATVSSAESAADVSALIHSQLSPAGDDEADPVQPLTSIEFQRRMLMALPRGWDARQMKAEHPNAEYSDFHRSLVSEQARPLSMPYNLAACDSSTYSFASGKLDFHAYRVALDVERQDANDLVLEPVFAAWWAEWTLAVERREIPPPHEFVWPTHPVIDAVAEAQAQDTKLKNGTTTLRQVYSDAGQDYEDQLQIMAEDYGVDVDTMRRILLNAHFPAAAAATATRPTQPEPTNEDDTVLA
jgi:capsid protein